MAKKSPRILNESPNRDLLELKEEDISLKTHEARLKLTELTMLATLSKEISHADAKLIYAAVDLASRMEDRVQKSEAQVVQIIAQIGESLKEDLKEDLETDLEQIAEKFKVN